MKQYHIKDVPQAEIAPKHGMGKGLMRKGVVPKPKKKKDVALKRSKSISAEDNIFSDLGEALEYAKQVNIDETEKQEKELKLKAKVQQSPEAELLLNLKKQIKASIEQSILDEAKIKAIKESLGVAPESLDHSSSSNDSSESADDDKTDSERDSDHDESENDSENRDESDKSNFDNESAMMTPSLNITTTSAEDYTRYMNDPKDVQITELLNKPVQTEATTMTVSHTLEIIHKTSEQVTETPPATPPTKTKTKKQQAKNLMAKAIKKKNDWKKAIMLRLTNLEQQNHTSVIEESIQANVLNEVRNQLPKVLPKAVSDALKQTPVKLSQPTPTPSVDPLEYELKHQLYEKMFQTAAYLKHPKHRALYDALQERMKIDELKTRFGSTKPSYTKQTNNDQDPKDHEGEKSKKRRCRGASESSSKKNEDQDDEPPHFERGNDVEETRQDDEQVHEDHEVQNNEIPSKHNPVWFQKSAKELPIQSWFNELVNAKEELEEYE
ncbi:hypothetical protein Tco_1336982 [Tanacetum coccineum]